MNSGVAPAAAPRRGPGRRSSKESRLTQARLFVEAENLFASRGYEGTSMRELSAGLGIAGSSVLHHIGSKRKLYGAILQRISDSVNTVLQNIEQDDPAESLRHFVERFMLWTELHPAYSQILVREMMENPRRLERVHHWHLAEFLERALSMTSKATAARNPRIGKEMLLMCLIGAVTYFNIALPTYIGVRGGQARDLKRQFVDTIDEMLRATLAPVHGKTKSPKR